MDSAQAIAGDTRRAGSALDSYQRLSFDEVMADLPNLGVDELLLVESLEEAGLARHEILYRIDDLLVGMAAAPGPVAGPAPLAPVAPVAPVAAVAGYVDHDEYDGQEYDEYDDEDLVQATPPAPAAPVPDPQVALSVDLLDQMGGLLERHEARRAAPPAAVVASSPAVGETAPPVPDGPLPEVISPRRRRGRAGRLIKVVVGLILVAVVAFGGATYLGRMGAGSTGTGASTNPVPAAAPASMAPRLIAEVPGYTLDPAGAGATGPVDLARAVKDDGGSDAQAVLARAGFVQGYRRAWSNTAQRQVVVNVSQFRDAAGATAYAQRRITADRAGLAALKGADADFPVPGIPGAVGMSATGSGSASAVVVFTKNGYLAELTVKLPASGGTAMAQQLATQEYALL